MGKLLTKVEFNKKSFKQMLALNAALQLSDVASTYIFRKVPESTMKEGNPLFRYIIHNDKWGLAISIKVAYWLFFSRKMQKLYSEHPEQIMEAVAKANLIMGVVVLWNLSHVARHLKRLNSK